ncbi:MAG TPA: hypothetical protein VGO80_03590 [Solirubrobacteraceae bacterium]|nr:hypothetical protein [Solirubrobacteraceae bacterium]
MSTQPTDDQDGVVYVGPADCATGELEPFASKLEYIARLNAAGAKLEQQLAKLGPEFFVLAGGYGRAEIWSPDAIVVGTPGVFLIHVVWGDAELPLWYSSESCRLDILKGLGPGFTGMVEVVFFSPGAGEGEQMERLVFPPAVGSRGFNVLFVDGDLVSALAGYVPAGHRISPGWLGRLRKLAEPRWELGGPDPRAQQLPLRGFAE